MKKISIVITGLAMFLSFAGLGQNNGKPDVFQKANNGVNKVNNVLALFQPYFLKARQLFYDAKQLGTDVKNSSKAAFGKNGTNNGTNGNYNGGQYTNAAGDAQNGYNTSNTNYNQGNNNGGYNTGNTQGNQNSNGGYPGQGDNSGAYQNYMPDQSLPVNNPATVNNDGSGNWGNQNNGLYGNCLDVLTGTIMGMGEAAATPTAVDLMFFAPADGQNTYYLITPGFAKSNSSVTYWTEHTSDQVGQWSDVNETEVALTKLTIGQFNQIQNNSQIQNAVRNAQNYDGYYTSVGQKLDGKVFAVKAQLENREVYALVAVVKQFGTSGSNGYLKINLKAQGVNGGNGQVNASSYIR